MNTAKPNKDGQAFHMDGKFTGHAKEIKENSTNFSEKPIENSKEFEKGSIDANSDIMNMYNKQLQLMTGFYNNFFNPGIGNNKAWNTGNGFSTDFFNGDLTKVFSNPFNAMNTTLSNPLLSSFDKMYKQMLGYSHNLLSVFNIQANVDKIDWSEVGKKYLETVEKRLEASKNVFNLLNEAYAGQVASSIETNKKTMEEISNRFNLVIKENQNFWADILESYQGGNKSSKEPSSNESKNRADKPIIA
jgi:hypothetical protein